MLYLMPTFIITFWIYIDFKTVCGFNFYLNMLLLSTAWMCNFHILCIGVWLSWTGVCISSQYLMYIYMGSAYWSLPTSGNWALPTILPSLLSIRTAFPDNKTKQIVSWKKTPDLSIIVALDLFLSVYSWKCLKPHNLDGTNKR